VLFDLDRFTGANEGYGHQAGDRVLADVARRVAAAARPGDLVARVGGDEFAWILPETDSLDAWQAAERVRESVAGTPVAGVGPVTISGGVCDLVYAEGAADLFRLADGALYWAKAQGRDVCFRYAPEVVAALSAEERAERLEREQALTSVRLLARVVDAKDPSTRRHSERVAELAVRLATVLGWSEERADALREAGLVHDVGKVGVPDRILFKPGRLTQHEYAQVKGHAALGAQIVGEVLSAEQVAWVRSHHERPDGAGYPDALAGDAVPVGARILAVADAWDVMTSTRRYSLPMPAAEALDECLRQSGSQFFPDVVEALIELAARGELEPASGAESRAAPLPRD
jgi:diguanylate cyclase (GGDEF)-like protein/putative nucleotidyltransferase with HDIG domain